MNEEERRKRAAYWKASGQSAPGSPERVLAGRTKVIDAARHFKTLHEELGRGQAVDEARQAVVQAYIDIFGDPGKGEIDLTDNAGLQFSWVTYPDGRRSVKVVFTKKPA